MWFDPVRFLSMSVVCCYLKIEKLSWFGKGVCENKLEEILQDTVVVWFQELLNLSLYVEAGLLVCHFTM